MTTLIHGLAPLAGIMGLMSVMVGPGVILRLRQMRSERDGNR